MPKRRKRKKKKRKISELSPKNDQLEKRSTVSSSVINSVAVTETGKEKRSSDTQVSVSSLSNPNAIATTAVNKRGK